MQKNDLHSDFHFEVTLHTTKIFLQKSVYKHGENYLIL